MFIKISVWTSWGRTILFYLFFVLKMNEFENRLKYSRGYSEYTVRNYLLWLKLFDICLKANWCKWVEECEAITLYNIDCFVREQRFFRWKSERTVNVYLAWIRLYLRFWLIQWKRVEDYRKILFIKEHRKKIESLSEEECVKLFEYFKNVKCKNWTEELIKTRNLVIVSMFMYTWLRLAELANLKCKDIWEDMQIIGKGGKERYISIHPDDLWIIKLYLFMRKDNSEWLFVSHAKNCNNRKLSNVSIEKIISDGAKAAWIEHRVFPHMLRHTFATNLLRCNAPLPHIQKLLGHSNLTTTQIYLTVLNSEIKKTQNSIKRFS